MEYNTQRAQSNNMASLACIMGLLSIVLLQTVLLPLFLGSIAIIIAILSKGYEKKMVKAAKIGFITSLVGITLTIGISSASVWMYFNNDAYRAEKNEIFQEMTGMTIEEYYNSYYAE